MRSNRDGDFDKSIEQLIQLLRKIMKTHPDQSQFSKLQSVFRDHGVNINLCFFNFFPVGEGEIDELEEICEQYLSDDEKKPEDLTTDLNPDDLDFLRKHGLSF